jgi:hypothetical protein
MAVFGLVSMQQITYHMKVRPPLRTLTTLILTNFSSPDMGLAHAHVLQMQSDGIRHFLEVIDLIFC